MKWPHVIGGKYSMEFQSWTIKSSVFGPIRSGQYYDYNRFEKSTILHLLLLQSGFCVFENVDCNKCQLKCPRISLNDGCLFVENSQDIWRWPHYSNLNIFILWGHLQPCILPLQIAITKRFHQIWSIFSILNPSGSRIIITYLRSNIYHPTRDINFYRLK